MPGEDRKPPPPRHLYTGHPSTTQNGRGEPAVPRSQRRVPAKARAPATPGPAVSSPTADSGQPNPNKALTEMLPRK